MSVGHDSSDRLDSWKEIASYLGRNVRTAMRWEQGKGLPVHRIPGGQRNAVYAWRHEIDAWLEQEGPDLSDQAQSPANDTTIDLSETPAGLLEQETTEVSTLLPPRVSRYRRIRKGVLSAAALVIIVLAAGGYALHSRFAPRQFRVKSVAQITYDGFPKIGLVSDGNQIYFSEQRDGRYILSTVAVQGGPVREIPTAFVRLSPVDISQDGKNLLVLAWESDEEEKTLWVVPVNGQPPHSVGQVRCNSATWSPDGQRIAFSEQNAIYLTTNTGEHTELLQSFDSIPQSLRWSSDGRWIRLFLHDPKGSAATAWDLGLTEGDQPKTSSLIPSHLSFKDCCSNLISMDKDGLSLIPASGDESGKIYFLNRDHGLLGSRFSVEKPDQIVISTGDTFADPRTRRVFVVGATTVRNRNLYVPMDLLSLDPKSKEFQPFLPGVDADEVDYSRDGKKIAYVLNNVRPEIKWSLLDGSKAGETSVSAAGMELPRWSPDGHSIAFMARTADTPWRIYVVSTVDGRVREASTGTDNQGAPTWSPDGKWLMYGSVRCRETHTCAVHKIELSTGRVTTVPGSEGLSTARWSPDGQYIAALRPDSHEVALFGFATQTWRVLATGVNGNDLSWSTDSRYVFASIPSGNDPQIIRISISNGHVEEAADLSSLAKLSGHVDTWFALAPDGSMIVRRAFTENDIFSIEYAEE